MNNATDAPAVVAADIPVLHGEASSDGRLLYVDNLRILLTVLVVMVHAAVTYGHIPVWYYTEPARDRSGVVLDVLVVLAQTFFMGFFFLIAGFFVPTSYDRKGGRRFLRDRLVRLGVPLAVFLVVLRPIVSVGFYPRMRAAAAARGVDLPYWKFYLATWSPGPMWFVAVLLVFSALYALARWCCAPRAAARVFESAEARPSISFFPAVVGYSLALAAATALWRLAVPVGRSWPFLGPTTPAYLPQYASLFVVGLLACRRGWAQALPVTAGWLGLAQALLATATIGPAARAARRIFGPSLRPWTPTIFAIWESLFAVGVIVALVVLFRQRLNRQGTLAAVLAANAYAVYVIHPLVLVGLGYSLRWLHAPALVKFTALIVLGLPLCWLSAYIVRSVPRANRVL